MAIPFHQPDCWAWSEALQRHHLSLCWAQECDIDPLILLARQLRRQGDLPRASWVEEELLPLF
ncbi:MAG: hypothetical protein VKI39_06310 [Synechococcus sp.]|nr:hypothetical protein [Synechococcus sp.]